MMLEVPLEVGEGSSVQLLTARGTDAAREACLSLLLDGAPRARRLVAVTVAGSTESFLDAWLGHGGLDRGDLTVVDVGTGMRSSAAAATPASTRNVIQSVGEVEDLAPVRGRVEDLMAVPVSPGQQRLVYLDSVSGLLEEVGPSATFDFVAAMQDLAERTGSLAVVHAHQPSTSEYATDVVDRLVDVTLAHSPQGDGNAWSVRSGRTAIEVDASVGAPSVDDVFGLLADRHRRLALQLLLVADGPLSTSDLATQLAEVVLTEEDRADVRSLKRLYTGLVYDHLPSLAAAGAVLVDDGGDAVRIGPAAEPLEPLLALAAGGDLRA